MQRDVQVFLDFLCTEKRAARVAQIQPRNAVERIALGFVVLIGKMHDEWFSPNGIKRVRRDLAATE